MEALPAVVVLILSVLGCGVAIYKSTDAAASGELPNNGSVGIRTRATRESLEAWRAGHEAALPAARKALQVGYLGAGFGVLGLVVLLATDLPILLGIIAPGVCQLVQLGYCGYAVSFANRAARAVTASAADAGTDSATGDA
ncbi:hypothetical protein FHS23_001365 [Prauserella isguenensis]|uniref:SdpI/YhfL family protein n=1 Tax=Prauserella isguenensis TaxID=1470180 RepID=A0A839RZX7_9PSEU|nr:SdpI family protein [Prauserella isguenensis]MBB3050370.1 hypothetical protein [Prauserella isguenensis]